jgi:hypothetical protein
MDPTAESAKEQVVVAHQGDVTHLAVDMSGQQVVSGDRLGSVALWSVEDGQLRAVGPGRSAGTGVTAGAFSAGARRLVTNGEAGILLWDNSIESWRKAACAIAGRGLTPQERRGYEPDLDGVRVCAAD